MKMKKVTRFTYINLRILLGIVFVVSVVGIFLNEDHSVKSDYMFNAAQSGMFLAVSLLPIFIKKIDLEIPDFIYLIFIIYALAHFFCGEILGFFVIFKWWDAMLHTFSGMFIALLAFSLIHLLSKDKENSFKANTWFVMIFAFSVALAIGAIWEIFEFACDEIFGLNMQRAYVSTMSGRGEPFVGTDALRDTMKDLILDSLGAFFVCVICAIFVAKKKVKLEDLTFIRKRVKPVEHLNEVVAEAVANQESEELSQNVVEEKVVVETIPQEIVEEKPKQTKKKTSSNKTKAKNTSK